MTRIQSLSMIASTLRILDANANRVREALRVLEDYTRFILNDPALSTDLKTLRHDLTTILSPLLPQALLHRDTPKDVGREIKTNSELHRPDTASVIAAAGKRVGEALRSLGEFSKISQPAAASQLEQLRYRFYSIEQQIALTLRPQSFANVRLCVLITESLCKRPWLEVAEQAILGGADCLQLREKNLEGRELLTRAKAFVSLCKKHNTVCIINDHLDIALLSDADGVHVGQGDLPAIEARKLVGSQKILGVSTHNLDQARQAVLASADYIGTGPVFPSPTKPRDFLPGLAFATAAAKEISIPVLAIAGITPSNVDQVIATGVTGVAVTAAVIGCNDPKRAASELKARFHVNR